MAEEENKQNSSKNQETEVPENLKNIVKEIEGLKVSDLAKLVKVLEEKFGVSAQMPMVTASVSQAPKAAEEEKKEFDVVLKNPGSSKIAVIKLVKEITGKGLKDSKDLVDASEKEPQVLKEKVKKEEAEEIKKKLEEKGATIELR
ncbi:50S ribosomal protein L7/L12 [bacterium]|nr:50S ribosomal protein L7/L12 [bacterium]